MDNEKNTAKDLDLSVLIMAIYRKLVWLFDKFIYVFVYSLRTVWKHKLVTLIVIISAILISVVPAYMNKNMTWFVANGTVKFKATSVFTMTEINKDLNKLSRMNQYDLLAERLGVDEQTASTLKDINTYYYVAPEKKGAMVHLDLKNEWEKDTTLEVCGDKIFLEVNLTDPKKIKEIEAGLIRSYTNNEIVRRDYERVLGVLNARLVDYEIEYKNLDSLRRLDYFHKETQARQLQIDGPMIVSDRTRQLYHTDLLTLSDGKCDVQQTLTEYKLSPHPEFISELTVVNKIYPIVGSTLKDVIKFLILEILFFAFLDKRKSIVRFLDGED